MKVFEITAQERPWYGSPYYVIGYEARNLDSAIKKALKEHPECVWFWYGSKVVYENPKAMERYRKANPGVVFYHY